MASSSSNWTPREYRRTADVVSPGFVGAVLAGGASRRMGRDKALVPVDGVAMIERVIAAVKEAV